jgi:hypothetical protein
MYTHHGIDIGDGTVVHLSKGTSEVCRVSLATFSDGRNVLVREYLQCDSVHDVIDRALSWVGNAGYHLWCNNCEHFATWCMTGRWESAQVSAVQERLVAVGVKGTTSALAKVPAKGGLQLGAKAAVVLQEQLAAAGAKRAADAVGKILAKATAKGATEGGAKLGAKAITRAPTPWLLLADAAQIFTEVTASQLGAKPANAQQLGRTVGLAGSATIGGVVAGLPGAGVAVVMWAACEVIGWLFSSSRGRR